jgi:hypothetical protein
MATGIMERWYRALHAIDGSPEPPTVKQVQAALGVCLDHARGWCNGLHEHGYAQIVGPGPARRYRVTAKGRQWLNSPDGTSPDEEAEYLRRIPHAVAAAARAMRRDLGVNDCGECPKPPCPKGTCLKGHAFPALHRFANPRML